MENIYLLIQVGFSNRPYIHGGFSTKEKAQAAMLHLEREDREEGLEASVSRMYKIEPLRFDSGHGNGLSMDHC